MLGLITSIALVVNAVIGTGIFLLPAALAKYGSIALVAFLLITIGSIILALIFGSLNLNSKNKDGNIYICIREVFGEFAGFINAWSYWITAWAGNAAIVVAWVSYVEIFINQSHTKTYSILIAIIGLWISAIVNLISIRFMSFINISTAITKILPLLIIGIIGLFFIEYNNFKVFNISNMSMLGALNGASSIALFSYLGIETASVEAGRIKGDKHTVLKATIIGTLICALIYLSVLIVIFGTVTNEKLQNSSSPFVDSASAIFHTQWINSLIAITAIISGFGSLISWTLLSAEMPHSAAKDELFPSIFKHVNKKGMPTFGIIVSTILASILTLLAYTKFNNVFNSVVLLTVLTSVIPYLFAISAQIYWTFTKKQQDNKELIKNILKLGIALLFVFWLLIGSGQEAIYYGIIFIFLGVPIYVYMKIKQNNKINITKT